MAEILSNLGEVINDFLTLELWSNGRIRLSILTILEISALALGGRLLYWTLSRGLNRTKVARGLDEGRIYTILQISKYLVYTFFVIMALETIGIKVTTLVTTFAALFVGLGLGLQDAFKDLSSGVILLVERTLSVGDIILMNEDMGRVEAIGLRTTTIRNRDDILLIVPNSKLTNEQVINLTHSEATTRFGVQVGVAYGTDTKLVERVLIEVAKSHPDNDSSKEPMVIFKDFGESELTFQLFFYTTDLFRIERIRSDMRFAIDDAFRKEGITIPFPQRTIWRGELE